MDEKVLASIVLAALGGLTFLAYKHPEAYEKLFWPLVILLNAALFGAIVWDAGLGAGYRIVREYVNQGSLNEASQMIEANKVLGWRVFVWFIGIALYLVFLSVLPLLIEKKKPDGNADGKNP